MKPIDESLSPIVDLFTLIKSTQNARDGLRADSERTQDRGLLLFSQCAGTMVEILKHVERQEKTISDLTLQINNLTTQVAWFWEKLEPMIYEGRKR